jgi:hypothetical protein
MRFFSMPIPAERQMAAKSARSRLAAQPLTTRPKRSTGKANSISTAAIALPTIKSHEMIDTDIGNRDGGCGGASPTNDALTAERLK